MEEQTNNAKRKGRPPKKDKKEKELLPTATADGRDVKGRFTHDVRVGESTRFQKQNAARCKYRDGYAEDLLEYFTKTAKAAQETGAKYPTFEEFAFLKGVTICTVENWRKISPAFDNAHELCEQFQKSNLIQNALNGSFNPNFAKFLASANFGMRETSATDQNLVVKIDMPKEVEEESE